MVVKITGRMGIDYSKPQRETNFKNVGHHLMPEEERAIKCYTTKAAKGENSWRSGDCCPEKDPTGEMALDVPQSQKKKTY